MGNRKCRQEACLVHHQPDIVTDAEEDNVDVEESIVDAEEETNNIKGFSSVKSDAVECEVSVPNEIVGELLLALPWATSQAAPSLACSLVAPHQHLHLQHLPPHLLLLHLLHQQPGQASQLDRAPGRSSSSCSAARPSTTSPSAKGSTRRSKSASRGT